ncbi:unnamed protein product [Phytomonas sp. Hart1]|nr:unnamed protein product [Phytomonas sp. Hart1]|eukprot:CCW65974.1 unnamed protein product [Phytomonas sp. isolate Hart1]
MPRNACTAVHVAAHMECQVCFDTWSHPMQLNCGHIFCEHCVPTCVTHCHICHSHIFGMHPPSDHIIEETLKVPVLCSSCGWRGTRKASEAHRCDSREVHSMFESYPQLSDDDWFKIATNQPLHPPRVAQAREYNHILAGIQLATTRPDLLANWPLKK